MNKIYKLIWSKVKNCYVVTSELAKNHTKGCSGKRVARLLAVGAVVAGLMLPMGCVEAISTSYVPSYNSQYGSSGPADYQTDGGHVDVGQIGGYNQQAGSYYNYVYVNDDGTINFYKNENYQQNDISSMVGNVAIGNFSQAGSAADAKMVGFYNSSMSLAYETKPEGATGTWYQTSAPDGKLYWYQSSWNNRTYAYSPTYNYGGTFIEKDRKYYHGVWMPDLDDEGNYQYDEQGNTIGSYKYAEIGEKIWKQNPDNPSGNLLVDYKKVDEYGQPVFDLKAEDIGLDESNPYGYSGGTNNVAVGNKSKTLSHSSVAVGDTSTARGYRSVAIGAQAEAGQENAGGDWNNGTSAVAIGDSAKAYGGTSVAVGSHAQTWSFSGIAVGNGSNAGTEYGIAIGDAANIAYIGGAEDIEQQRTAAQSIAIGRSALAQAKDVTAVGRNAQGMMRNATAYGNNAHANAWNSIAIGNKATAGLQADIVNEDGTAKDGTIGNSAVSIGNRARAEAEYTTAIGAGTWAEGWHAVAVGDSNRATGRFSTAIGAGWSINHTEGEPDSDDATDGSDAINTEGNRTYDSFGANQAGGDYSSAVGYGNMTVGTQSNAFGKENKVSGLSSLGVGSGNEVGTVAVGDNNVLEKPEDQENTVSGYAVGSYNKITGTEGTNAGAFGANNTVAGDNAYAVGNSNTISEDATGALAVGSGNTVEGEQSIAVGTGHTVTGKNSGAFGDPDNVNADSSYVVGNNSTIDEGADGSFVIGNDASATVEKSVALGSESHAYRDKENGGAGAGYDVTTGTNYAGDGADSPTWVSTLGAVSVGGTAKDDDAEIGTAASATRQITGVAAGTADTDAVNVAQLKLIGELSRTEVANGTNITVDESKDEQDGHTIYTVNGLKTVVTSSDGSVEITPANEDNADKTGVIKYDLKVKPATNVKVTKGDNITVTEEKEGDVTNYVINATDTVTNVKEGDNVYVTEEKDGDKITYTVSADKTVVEGGDNVTVTSDTDEATHVTTYKIDAKDTVTNIKEGNNVHVTEEKEGDKITYTVSADKTVVEGGDNVEVTSVTDEGTNTTTYTIKATDTTYTIDAEAGEKGSGVVNTYTMTGTNGDKYTFEDTDTDTTYKIEEKREKKGTVAATYTVTDSNNNKVGEIQDTHNGLTGDTYKVEYDENGVGSVTIEDQDGNKATITNIQSGGEGNADAINRLGDQITRLDSKIEKVGAGAAALAGLHPLDFDPDEKWDFAASVGSYKSEQAVAIGAFYRPNEDTMFSIGGTIGNGNNMVNVGVSWKFGQKNRISANRISSAKEIIELRKNQEDVHSFLADAVAGNQLDLSKIQLFPDVEENHWAYDYVATMAGNGVLEGYPDGYFKGNRNMTRYEMAAVLYRLMQNGARLSDRALTEFAPELDRIRVDTITKHKDGTPHIQRVRTIKERVDEKSDLSPEKAEKKKAKIKVAEKPVE